MWACHERSMPIEKSVPIPSTVGLKGRERWPLFQTVLNKEGEGVHPWEAEEEQIPGASNSGCRSKFLERKMVQFCCHRRQGKEKSCTPQFPGWFTSLSYYFAPACSQLLLPSASSRIIFSLFGAQISGCALYNVIISCSRPFAGLNNIHPYLLH